MRGELKSIFSPDVHQLEHWIPDRPDFGVRIQLFIGSDTDDKFDSFDITLCTPNWFAAQMREIPVRSGQYTLFVLEYDYQAFVACITSYIRRCEGETWAELAAKLGHLGSWEFQRFNSSISEEW